MSSFSIELPPCRPLMCSNGVCLFTTFSFSAGSSTVRSLVMKGPIPAAALGNQVTMPIMPANLYLELRMKICTGGLSYKQGCESSFSKELSSQFKFPGHQELLFSSSSSTCIHELSYSSVQFHPLVWVRAIDLKAGKEEKGNRTNSSCFAQDFSQHTKVLC